MEYITIINNDIKFYNGAIVTLSGSEYVILEKLQHNKTLKLYYKTKSLKFNNECIVSRWCLQKHIYKNLMEPSIHNVGFIGQGDYNPNYYKKHYYLWNRMLKKKECKNIEIDERWYNFQNFCEDIQELEGYNEWIKNSLTMFILKNENACYNKNNTIFLTKNKKIKKESSVIYHGMSRSRFYRIYITMKRRCFDPSIKFFKNYGGRGISVCDRWLDFVNFKEDMYESYLKHCDIYREKDTTIDRIDVNGNYEPSNCKWSTMKEQESNKRNIKKYLYKNEYMSLSEICRIENFKLSIAVYRKDKGVEDIMVIISKDDEYVKNYIKNIRGKVSEVRDGD